MNRSKPDYEAGGTGRRISRQQELQAQKEKAQHTPRMAPVQYGWSRGCRGNDRDE